MSSTLLPFMLATDLADCLVRKDVPFRETHRISRRCVAKSGKQGIPMNELSLEQAIDGRFEEDVSHLFDYERSVEMRAAKGGCGRDCVLEQINVLKAMLAWSGFTAESLKETFFVRNIKATRTIDS
ncbi:argininosuccinate lyase [Fusarium pseudocircinatum]|uniref:Argininosuccinate lyase n=1 Tax=Fusarium pseudocircinatum TaxID=56676 RepID=A0A8H5NYL1_9HYPO|nr:argininosuccinate lyase [Fusarium pseudocircinatum]